jgi:hypothetical protein
MQVLAVWRRESTRVRLGEIIGDRESTRQYSLQINEDNKKEYSRQYRLQNSDKAIDSVRQYRLKNEHKLKDAYDEYYLLNKDRISEAMRDYGLQNMDKKRDYDRRYNLQTKDKKKESHRQYRKQNQDKIRELKREYHRDNHDSPASYYPRQALNKSWKSPELVREYFESIAQQLHISDFSDWYRISRGQIKSLDGMQSCISIANTINIKEGIYLQGLKILARRYNMPIQKSIGISASSLSVERNLNKGG